MLYRLERYNDYTNATGTRFFFGGGNGQSKNSERLARPLDVLFARFEFHSNHRLAIKVKVQPTACLTLIA